MGGYTPKASGGCQGYGILLFSLCFSACAEWWYIAFIVRKNYYGFTIKSERVTQLSTLLLLL